MEVQGLRASAEFSCPGSRPALVHGVKGLPHSMSTTSRRGNTLVVVLALTLLMASQIYIVNTLSMGNFRHVGKVNAHVRAIYVGESAFARMLARMKAAPWESRWFATAPQAEDAVPFGGGTYASYVATVPGETKQADVWIQARYEGSVAVMFWRVRFVDDTLDFYAQVYPTFFTFLPPDTAAPTGGPNPTTTMIVDMIEQQQSNEAPALAALETLSGQLQFDQIAQTLQIPLQGTPLDTLTPPGGTPMAGNVYLGAVAGTGPGASPRPTAPPPPPPPASPPPPPPLSEIPQGVRPYQGPRVLPQSPMGQRYPHPTNVTDVVRAILAETTSTPPMDADLPTSDHFSDPVRAQQEWQTATQQFVVSWEMSAIGIQLRRTSAFVGLLAARDTATDPRPESRAAANAFLAYYADITNAHQLSDPSRPVIDPASVDPAPGDAAGYTRALDNYAQWWLDNH